MKEDIVTVLIGINETLKGIRQDLNDNKNLKQEVIKVVEEMKTEIKSSPFYGLKKPPTDS